ncbi:hypothetical protein BC829DRAFT_374361, partial [Chytridium lagenaria]
MAGVQKVLDKLKKSVEDGNYYEAHQMYHSVCQRHLKQKKTADAVALLHSGATSLLTHKQIGSGSDLALRMVDIFISESEPINDVNKSKILEIFQAFPLDDSNYLRDFIRGVTRWTAKVGQCSVGDPQLHHAFGSRFFREKLYFDAEFHFLYGTLDSAKSAGKMAFEWSQVGYAEDGGYFLARVALGYLAQKRLKCAYLCLESFTQSVSDGNPSLIKEKLPFRSILDAKTIELPVYGYPLANFVQLLIYSIQREAVDQFTLLRAEYRQSLNMDSYLYELLDRIADVWFGLGPKKQPNILEDLMKSLFAG